MYVIKGTNIKIFGRGIAFKEAGWSQKFHKTFLTFLDMTYLAINYNLV